MRLRLLGTVVLIASTLTAPAVAAPAVAVAAPATKTLHFLEKPANAKRTSAKAVNNRGQVAGQIDGRAVRWGTDGRPRYLKLLPGMNWSYASDINRSGVVVGVMADDGVSPFVHAVRWDAAGNPSLLAPSEERATWAYAVNDRGDAVGWRGAAYAARYPVRFLNGVAEPLPFADRQGWLSDLDEHVTSVGGFYTYGCACPQEAIEYGNAPPATGGIMTLGGSDTQARAVSRDGSRIAGTVNGYATVWALGSHRYTGYPTWTVQTQVQIEPGVPTSVSNMNRAGTILVGSAESRGAWIYQQGVFSKLPGVKTAVTDVNDSGVAVGSASVGTESLPYAVMWR